MENNVAIESWTLEVNLMNEYIEEIVNEGKRKLNFER